FGMMRKVLPSVRTAIAVGDLDASADGVLAFDAVYSAEQPVDVDQATEDECAVILYTSGTTGNPKGAMLSHRNMVSNAVQCGDFLDVKQTDTVVAVLPMFHVFCMTVCLNTPIYRGATVLLIPRFSPTETAKTIHQSGATFFAGVPTMFNFLTQHPEVQPEELRSLRFAISGGAPMPVAVLHNFEQKFGVNVSEGYGLSEASPVVCFNPIDRERKPGTIGVELPGVEVRVVDEEGRNCAPGVVGELICKGPNVMIGYLNRPEDTAVTIRDGWLYTGDLATVDEEGYYTIVDRKKDMVIVGGFNVYPREVEEVLFKHPAVREAAVIGLPDPNYGEKVRAFVALNHEVTVEALTEYCAEHLSKYKVPKEIVVIDELPKNTTGKILRRELKKSELPSA
ncbi:MAG: long-chain fatty acid--CoA ligase, partial [Tumebacillaceae bacterium]